MMLTPRELDKMIIWTVAQIATQRKDRGVKLNLPESIAFISNYVVEGAREGKTVADLMKSSRNILEKNQVMEGVPELIKTLQVEATFPDGTKLVTIHDPVQDPTKEKKSDSDQEKKSDSDHGKKSEKN